MDAALLSQFPAIFARTYRVLPLYKADGILYVAMSDVLDRAALEALRFRVTASIEPVYAPLRDIERALEEHYFAESIVPLSEEELQRSVDDVDQARAEPAIIADNVLVRLANQRIAEACRARASDIHIEPSPGRGATRMRFRIDGRTLTIGPEETAAAAYRKMCEVRCHHLPVVTDGVVVEMVGRSDLLDALRDSLVHPVAESDAAPDVPVATAPDAEERRQRALMELYRTVGHYLHSGRGELENSRLLRAFGNARELLERPQIGI